MLYCSSEIYDKLPDSLFNRNTPECVLEKPLIWINFPQAFLSIVCVFSRKRNPVQKLEGSLATIQPRDLGQERLDYRLECSKRPSCLAADTGGRAEGGAGPRGGAGRRLILKANTYSIDNNTTRGSFPLPDHPHLSK
ncbi:hypothetical protein BaRGS_00013632 [Batillaria attramentaria]|uniref:Uncharacterized protein n=1 Tax=Batillaria attramentaria TaxID=370345 RepID=A0ABD0L7S7_9CAEN